MLSIANVVGIFDLIGEHGGDDFYVSTLHSIRPLKKKKKNKGVAPQSIDKTAPWLRCDWHTRMNHRLGKGHTPRPPHHDGDSRQASQ